MGGFKQASSAATWIGLSEGKFSVKNAEGVAEKHNCFEGTLISVGFVDKEYQGKSYRQLTMAFFEGSKLFKLGLGSDSGYGKQTIMKLANCDISQPIEFSPTFEVVGGKKRGGMFLNQLGSPVKQRWTKDDPGDCPLATNTGTASKPSWSFEKQAAWLEDWVMANIAPKAAANMNKPRHDGEDLSHAVSDGDSSQDVSAPDGDTPF